MSSNGLTSSVHKNGDVVEGAASLPPGGGSAGGPPGVFPKVFPLEALERDALLPPLEVDAYGVAPEDALLSCDANKNRKRFARHLDVPHES